MHLLIRGEYLFLRDDELFARRQLDALRFEVAE